MDGYIDKCRLLFLGKLCNSKCNSSFKDIFCVHLATCHCRTFVSHNICDTLIETCIKYNIFTYLSEYLDSGNFPCKSSWRKTVLTRVIEFESKTWVVQVCIRPDMYRYHLTHNVFGVHRLYYLMYFYPQFRDIIQLCVKISSRAKFSKHCELCDRHCNDYDCHIILHCEHFMYSRNNFFSKLIDLLDVNVYVEIEMLSEDEMISLFSGGDLPLTTAIDEMSWRCMIILFCKFLYTMSHTLNCTF